jgi:CheY-like chemotaxis protein
MPAPVLLVVDDLPEVLLIVERYGRRAGHQVIGCLNVATAWDHLRGLIDPPPVAALPRRPDLVLLDVNLPGVSGLELCRRIRATPALADLAVGLFSQSSQSHDVAAGLDAGVDFLVAKDLLGYPEQWRARLEEILPPARSRPLDVSLSWKGPVPRAHLEESVRGLNRALEYLSLRRLGPEVVQALLRRAFRDVERQVEPVTPTEQGGSSDFSDKWLREDGAGLAPEHVVPTDRPDVLVRVALALLDRLWCLLGTRESEGFVRALRTGVPLLVEYPSLR